MQNDEYNFVELFHNFNKSATYIHTFLIKKLEVKDMKLIFCH